jgi:heme/copper-type cytochrome/quinol oxidase subunit 1
MPRRIPDYPDAFYLFNFIASWGSFVSFISVCIFFITVIDSLSIRNSKPILLNYNN